MSPLSIPHIPGAKVSATYILDSVEQVQEIATEVGAVKRDSYLPPAIVEYHYPADEDGPERWILVCFWSVGEVSCSAQAESTTAPSGAGAPA